MLAERPVARQRRLAGGDEVADAGKTEEGQRRRPERDAETRHLGEPARDERRLRVLAVPHADGHAVGEGDRRSSPSRRSRCRRRRSLQYGRKYAVVHASAMQLRRRRRSGRRPWSLPAGARRSRARGSGRTRPRPATRRRPATSAATSLIRWVVPCSMPFMSETSTAPVGSSVASTSRGWRAAVCAGTASTTTVTPRSASPGSAVAAQRLRQHDAGVVAGVLVRRGDRLGELGVAAPHDDVVAGVGEHHGVRRAPRTRCP